MTPRDRGYVDSLADELARLDCTTEDGRRFRDIALRLIELHQHQSVSIVMAVIALRDHNKLLMEFHSGLIPVITAVENAQAVMSNGKESMDLFDAKNELINMLRRIRDFG